MHKSNTPIHVSIVIPAYNPGPALVDVVGRVHRSLDTNKYTSHEIVVVSDGTTDGSIALLDDTDARLAVIELPINQGKGKALKAGIAETHGIYVAFIDADGDLPPELLPNMISLLIDSDISAVIGSRSAPGAQITSTTIRRILSRVFRIWVSLWIRISVSDTQVGIKAFKGDLIRALTQSVKSDGFAFDVELLWMLQKNHSATVCEYPVVQLAPQSSSVSLSRSMSALIEVARIRLRRYL